MNGWTGSILRVNLTTGVSETESTGRYIDSFLGGKGINAKILWDEVGPEVLPLSAENRLIFGVGPFVGTLIPGSCRCNVTSKSPQTGIFGDSNFGGYWGPELKFAGYDHLVIYGSSDRPVYLFIDDARVELRDARHLWGRDTIETQRMIKAELKNNDIQVACIGPAGENNVCIASINHGLGNSASRVGMGAVMGSKNLKAIAVRGTRNVTIAQPKELAEICADIMMNPQPEMRMMYEQMQGKGVLPGVHDPGVASYGSHDVTSMPEFEENYERMVTEFYRNHLARLEGCFNCPAPCKYLVVDPSTGEKIVIKCENNEQVILRLKLCDYEFNVRAVALCYRYGLDLFSVSAQVAFLMDLYEKGIITEKDTDGIAMRWRDGEAMLTMMEKIARREGCGALFADGILKAADQIGKESQKYVYHTKGLEWMSVSHYNIENALGCAVSETGCGLRACSGTLMALLRNLRRVIPRNALDAVIKMNFPPDLWFKVLDDESYDGKAEVIVYHERINNHIPDLLGTCKFLSGWLPFHFFHCDEMGKFIPLVTGKNIDGEALGRYAEKVSILARAYSVREGMRRKDDTVSEILFEEPSPLTGAPLDRKKFDEQLEKFYKLHGWDKNGIPTRERLEDLGLNDVVKDLQERNIL